LPPRNITFVATKTELPIEEAMGLPRGIPSYLPPSGSNKREGSTGQARGIRTAVFETLGVLGVLAVIIDG